MRKRIRYLTGTMCVLLAGAAFLPGLWGPFLLDTPLNLDVLKQWLAGDILWQGIVFENDSGLLGRPVSMLVFLLNAAVTGYEPFGFKLVNLLIHLVCAGLIFGFLKTMLQRDPVMGQRAALCALALALWWTLLPIHVSTVLYTIQRMAQLAALFMFAGLWLFVAARERIEAGRRTGHWMLWLGIPICTALAAFSKENGLLLPFLCLAVELGYFETFVKRNRNIDIHRSRSVVIFFALSVALPMVLGVFYFWFNPDFLTGGYINRSFTLVERTLTEPRILWSYIRDILIPFGPSLGLYHDNYQVSTGFFSPATTAVAIAAWGLLLGAAWRLRRTIPALLTGVLLYLFGHAMESSIFALELVFLHRNYLPALGVLLAVAGTAMWIYQRLPEPTVYFRRALPVLLVVLAGALWSATFARAWVWQSKVALVAQELEQHPHSLRMRLNAAVLALDSGYPAAALHQIEVAETFVPPIHRTSLASWKAVIYCRADEPLPESLVRQIATFEPERLHHYVLQPLKVVIDDISRENCPHFNARELVQAMAQWFEGLKQSPKNEIVWKFRYYLGKILAARGHYAQGLDFVRTAWQDSGKRYEPGVLVFRLAAALHRYDLCRRVVATMQTVKDGPDLRKRRYVRAFERYLSMPEEERTGIVPTIMQPEKSAQRQDAGK